MTLGFPQSLIKDVTSPAAIVSRWFVTLTRTPAIAGVTTPTGGAVRVGGQIDLAPVPKVVGALADVSIPRNADYKKSKTATGAGAAPVPAVTGTATQPETNKTLPTTPASDRIALSHVKLEEWGIKYETVSHAPVPDVPSMQAALAGRAGTLAKNLFVKAKKEKAPDDSRWWLIIAAADTKTDLNKAAAALGYGKITLRFAPEEEHVENLGVTQGNVTPFALMNDTALRVQVAVDARLVAPGAGPLWFHPPEEEGGGVDGTVFTPVSRYGPSHASPPHTTTSPSPLPVTASSPVLGKRFIQLKPQGFTPPGINGVGGGEFAITPPPPPSSSSRAGGPGVETRKGALALGLLDPDTAPPLLLDY